MGIERSMPLPDDEDSSPELLESISLSQLQAVREVTSAAVRSNAAYRFIILILLWLSELKLTAKRVSFILHRSDCFMLLPGRDIH